jgi:hypothetical protein
LPSQARLIVSAAMLRHTVLAILGAALCAAEELVPLDEQPAPFTVWLDFPALSRPDAKDPALPIWFESFQMHSVPAADGEPPKTVFRVRLRRLPTLQSEMLMRVYFDDLPELEPVVTAWSETGREQFRSEPLGIGIGLPTNESVLIPLEGVDYIDLEVAGDGSNIRGAFTSSLKDVTIRQTIDLQPAADVADPFGNVPPIFTAESDQKFLGRVKATLDSGIVRLTPEDAPAGDWHFELTAEPLATLVTFEVLNADLTAPPVVVANDGDPAFVNIHWPDFADPAYRGEGRGAEPRMRFQYTGWLRAQAVLPAGTLTPGLNTITVSLSEGSGSIGVRNVELQLKQNWKHFDYILTPGNR